YLGLDLLYKYIVKPSIPEGVSKGAHYGTVQCTLTSHNLFCKSHVLRVHTKPAKKRINVTPLYLQRGRQRYTLRHVIPMYTVHPHFTICEVNLLPYTGHNSRLHATIENNIRKPEKRLAVLRKTWESHPIPLARPGNSTNDAG
ncbi:hypothetical protein SFRURICE_007999, partial [Spodoptera frugiperda]